MSPEASSKLFLSAAIFNWVIGLGLFFVPDLFLVVLSITPTPDQSIWVQQFAGLVFIFGVGYYWASRDLQKNQSIVRLAVWGKSCVAVVALLNVTTGDISWQFMIPASADAIFAALFVTALKSSAQMRESGPV